MALTPGERRLSTVRTSCTAGSGRGRDDTHPLRQRRDLAFALLVEQALAGQPMLERVEGPTQCASASFLQVLDDELELPTLWVQSNSNLRQHLCTVIQVEVEMPIVHAKHRAANLAMLVLEREVEVTGPGSCQVGQLPLHPDRWEGRFERLTRLQIQARDGVDLTQGRGLEFRLRSGQVRLGQWVRTTRIRPYLG